LQSRSNPSIDLRKLTMPTMMNMLVGLGVSEVAITKLSRWERVGMIRKLRADCTSKLTSEASVTSKRKIDPDMQSECKRGRRREEKDASGGCAAHEET
jgi:hypothetical protein